MPEPVTMIDWIQQAGAFGFALVFAFLWQMELRARLEAQKDNAAQRERLLNQSLETTDKLAKLNESTRAQMAEHDRLLQQLFEGPPLPRRRESAPDR